MPNTYTSLHYHFVFSTKSREHWITQDIESRIWSFLGGIARDNDMKALCVGGIEDHVHLLIGAKPTMSPSKIAQLIKGGSSLWIHGEFPALSKFAWQDGYGAFTVSKSAIPDVIKYIQNQRVHHETKTFQEAFLELLGRHEIEYDERYLWD
jgi:putative transposase